MNTFIKSFLTLATVLGVVFGAYFTLTEKPALGLKEARAELEQRIVSGEASLRVEMRERREQRDKEIADFKLEIRAATGTLMNKLEKIDDRLYEIQRAQAQQNANAVWDDGANGG